MAAELEEDVDDWRRAENMSDIGSLLAYGHAVSSVWVDVVRPVKSLYWRASGGRFFTALETVERCKFVRKTVSSTKGAAIYQGSP